MAMWCRSLVWAMRPVGGGKQTQRFDTPSCDSVSTIRTVTIHTVLRVALDTTFLVGMPISISHTCFTFGRYCLPIQRSLYGKCIDCLISLHFTKYYAWQCIAQYGLTNQNSLNGKKYSGSCSL